MINHHLLFNCTS